MASIGEIVQQIESKRAEVRAKEDTAPRPEIAAITRQVRELGDQLSAAITEGAKPCPSCGSAPLGMLQEVWVSGEIVQTFEIGCTRCKDHRAKGVTRETTVSKWNLGPVPGGWRQPKDGTRLELKNGEVFRVTADDFRTSCRVATEGA